MVLALAQDRIDHDASFVHRDRLGKLFPRRSAWWTAVYPCSSCHRRDNGHLTCRMCALIAGLLLKKIKCVGDGGGGAKAAGWLGRKQHYVTRHPQSAPPPSFPPPPLFYSEQLDRSAAIGCTSSTWAALPFLAVPNGAANSMLLAGWQAREMGASKWGRLDEAQAPVKRTMGSLGPRRRHTGPASCHPPLGMINPRRTATHLRVLLFLIASLVAVLEKTEISSGKIWGF